MASNPHLTANQLAQFEERLQRERTRLLGLTTVPDAREEKGDPGDDADIAEVEVSRSTRATLTDDQRAQLSQVNRALAKLEDGTYGLSDVTGDPIPLARLEALPWATTNVEDAPRRR